MGQMLRARIVAAAVVVVALAVTVDAQVVVIGAGGGGGLGDKVRLDSVGVRRGGITDIYTYSYEELITPSLEAINVPAASPDATRTVLLYANPLDAQRDQTVSDQYVNTGLFDPGHGDGDFASPGVEYTKLSFSAPVVNDVGPDLLGFFIGFEFNTWFLGMRPYYVSFDGTTSFLVDQAEDMHMSAVQSIPYYAYHGGITSPDDFLSEVPSQTGWLGNPTAIPTPIVQSLDLSDFGVAPGASISSLYIHDSTNSGSIYPTLFAGLPAIPEPTTLTLLAAASVLAVRRRRRP
jgi:hypothetical protein